MCTGPPGGVCETRMARRVISLIWLVWLTCQRQRVNSATGASQSSICSKPSRPGTSLPGPSENTAMAERSFQAL